MDFEFSKDQNLIRQSAREFFEKECPMDRTRELMVDKKGYDPKMWKKMVQLGFAGLIIDEKYGGTEGEFLELAVLMEEMGRNIVPGPFFSTVCLCAPAIEQYGSDAHKKKLLPRIAEKGEIWSLALNEKQTTWERASEENSSSALAGILCSQSSWSGPCRHEVIWSGIARDSGQRDLCWTGRRCLCR